MPEDGSSAVRFRSSMRGCLRLYLTSLMIGMAVRLSFNLALNQDLKPYIAKGVVTAAEADLRRTVFWAAFVVDQ